MILIKEHTRQQRVDCEARLRLRLQLLQRVDLALQAVDAKRATMRRCFYLSRLTSWLISALLPSPDMHVRRGDGVRSLQLPLKCLTEGTHLAAARLFDFNPSRALHASFGAF
jgi:hypothetical protein